MRSVVSEKGEVTIPRSILDPLGLRPGEAIEVLGEDGKVVVRKASPELPEDLEARLARWDEAVRDLAGTLNLGKTTDELMDELRGPRDLT